MASLCRVVGMRFERSDSNVHPAGERERAEQN
jgi:hypothetical protein